MAYTPTNWVNGQTPINATNLNKIEQELARFGKTLWEGEWSSGTITVPNTDKYTAFQICFKGQGSTVLALKQNTHIRGIGGYSSASSTITTYHFAATFSGNVWTFIASNMIGHSPGGSHGEVTGTTPVKIVGLL